MQVKGVVTRLGLDTIETTTPTDRWRSYVAGRRWFEVEWDGDSRRFYSEELPPLGSIVLITIEVKT